MHLVGPNGVLNFTDFESKGQKIKTPVEGQESKASDRSQTTIQKSVEDEL